MAIETEHKGYEIRYSENEDCWNCYDLDVTGTSLSRIKAAIDKELLKIRKASAVDVIQLSAAHSSERKTTEVRAVDARPVGRRTYNATPGWDYEIGVMTPGKRGKSFVKASSLAEPTPEVFEQIKAARALQAEADKAEKLAREAWEAIPRISHEYVAGLIKAATEKVEEGSK